MRDESGGRRKRVTLRDDAREAGVSIKTVSRVLNNKAGVAEATSGRAARTRGAATDARPATADRH